MTGLIKKDMLLILKQCKALAVVLVLYVLWAVAGMGNLVIMLPVMSMSLLISVFTQDEASKWDAYAAALPVGRTKIVRAKYLVMLLTSGIICLFAIVVSGPIAYFFSGTGNYTENIISVVAISLGLILLQAFFLPFVFWFGINKARITVVVIMLGACAAIGILVTNMDWVHMALLPEGVVQILVRYGAILGAAGVLLLCWVSCMVSELLYKRREF